ncbi:MAG: hypothetical protein LBD27_07845 [Tannerella sp.]|nr:hypothetical protein [Tannerella sp.]
MWVKSNGAAGNILYGIRQRRIAGNDRRQTLRLRGSAKAVPPVRRKPFALVTFD